MADEIEHGPGPIGDEPRIGESFVWLKAEPGKWGEQIEQITDVIGVATWDDDKPATWTVVYWETGQQNETDVMREGDRWVRVD